MVSGDADKNVSIDDGLRTKCNNEPEPSLSLELEPSPCVPVFILSSPTAVVAPCFRFFVAVSSLPSTSAMLSSVRWIPLIMMGLITTDSREIAKPAGIVVDLE